MGTSLSAKHLVGVSVSAWVLPVISDLGRGWLIAKLVAGKVALVSPPSFSFF